jgi:hypothetical protein
VSAGAASAGGKEGTTVVVADAGGTREARYVARAVSDDVAAAGGKEASDVVAAACGTEKDARTVVVGAREDFFEGVLFFRDLVVVLFDVVVSFCFFGLCSSSASSA